MKQTTKRVVAFFAAMGLMVSGLSLNEPASADAKAKAKVKSVTIKNVKKKLTLKKGDSFKLKVSVKVKPNKAKYQRENLLPVGQAWPKLPCGQRRIKRKKRLLRLL